MDLVLNIIQNAEKFPTDCYKIKMLHITKIIKLKLSIKNK